MTTFRARRSRFGITIFEVVIAVLAVASMAVLSIPAIGRARATAGASTDRANQALLHVALENYAADNLGFTPTTCPTSAGDWYPDFRWSGSLKANVSSNGIWGNRSTSIPDTSRPWPPVPSNPDHYNESMGLGMLAEGNYTTVESLYVPATRNDDFVMWSRRNTFGLDLVYWDSSQPLWDGVGWLPAEPTGPYYGANTNYILYTSYFYRAGDWTSELRFTGGVAAGDPDGGLWRNMNPTSGPVFSKPEYCRPSYAGYTDRAIVINYRGYLHAPLTGGNVLFGDGSVVWWEDPNSWLDYTTNGQGPHDQWAGYSFHGVFASWLFMNADQKARD